MQRSKWLLAAGLMLATAAYAEVPATISVQGILTDAGGALLPNGPYSLTLSLYTVPAGGSALYTETHPAAMVVNGGFSVLLGSVTPLGLPFDAPYWLGIQVGADPELTPRVPLASAPYALSLRLPFSGRNDASGPALTVRNAAGPGILAGFAIDLEDGAAAHVIGMFSEFNLSPPLTPAGGGIVLFDENGVRTFFAGPSLSGGQMTIRRNTADDGFAYRSISGNGSLEISGASRQFLFNSNLSDDASVALPQNALSSPEILDEPGVTSSTQNTGVSILTPVTSIRSTTINCPAAGYVLVMGTCEATLILNAGVQTQCSFGVSTSASTLPANQDVSFILPSTLPNGTFQFPVSVHGLFQVSAGSNTFHFLAVPNPTGQIAADIQLTAIFIPTAYGTVTSTLLADGAEDAAAAHGPTTPRTLEQERRASEEANALRLERELAKIRADLAAMRRDLESRDASAVPAGGHR